MRRNVDAIAVGVNTVLADNPRLTVREAPAPRVAPIRVVFDRHARIPIDSALAQTARETPVVVVVSSESLAAADRLRLAGVDLLAAESLGEALAGLRHRGVEHLLVEGGATLASSFMEAGFVDRLVIFQAPIILGRGALHAFASLSLQRASSLRMVLVTRRALGADQMTIYAVSGV